MGYVSTEQLEELVADMRRLGILRLETAQIKLELTPDEPPPVLDAEEHEEYRSMPALDDSRPRLKRDTT